MHRGEDDQRTKQRQQAFGESPVGRADAAQAGSIDECSVIPTSSRRSVFTASERARRSEACLWTSGSPNKGSEAFART
jgi:hypothetical protein